MRVIKDGSLCPYTRRLAELPTWVPSMCDGCSVPSALRWVLNTETVEQRAACCTHDRAYYYGGSPAMRLVADQQLYDALIAADMPKWRAALYYYGVRVGGAPSWRYNPRRWSHGQANGQYAYTSTED